MRTVFTNIKSLLQVRPKGQTILKGKDMAVLPAIDHAYLIIDDGVIKAYGKMEELTPEAKGPIIDLSGKYVLPSWCDSHTHLVYAGNREGEFIDRINGVSYEDIAAKGGGILNSAKRLQSASEEELYQQAAGRLTELIRQGTGAIEIKSGYGLSVEAEIKMLRVIKRLRTDYPVKIKSTFLGAHAVPQKYKQDQQVYIDLLMHEMLPQIAEEGLADYIDVFCEKGYFSAEDTKAILQAGATHGLRAKIHVNQFNSIGGVQVAVEHGALTVDHLEVMKDADFDSLQESETLPVALPGCSFFLGIPYSPVRAMISKGLPVAIASDYNPGSCPSGNMNLILSLACIKLRILPEEAINAATLNAAYAMGIEDTHGSITVGKSASLIITKEISTIGFLPYSYGSDLIDAVYINGDKIR